jgi:hypothetical protein
MLLMLWDFRDFLHLGSGNATYGTEGLKGCEAASYHG